MIAEHINIMYLKDFPNAAMESQIHWVRQLVAPSDPNPSKKCSYLVSEVPE